MYEPTHQKSWSFEQDKKAYNQYLAQCVVREQIEADRRRYEQALQREKAEREQRERVENKMKNKEKQ